MGSKVFTHLIIRAKKVGTNRLLIVGYTSRILPKKKKKKGKIDQNHKALNIVGLEGLWTSLKISGFGETVS